MALLILRSGFSGSPIRTLKPTSNFTLTNFEHFRAIQFKTLLAHALIADVIHQRNNNPSINQIKDQPNTLTHVEDNYKSRDIIMHKTLIKLAFLIAISATSFNIHATDSPPPLKDDPIDPIRIFAIFHDDIPKSKRDSIYNEYLHPFIVEFESITGRKAHVVLDENKAPYSNFQYKGDDREKIVAEWGKLAWQYKKKRYDDKEFRASRNDRVLLITNDMINGHPLFGGEAGIADAQPGRVAIASLDFKQAIGHELGHTFNADHDDGEVLYNGWWCETFMFPPLPLRSNCMVFGDGNRKRIKDYVDSLY